MDKIVVAPCGQSTLPKVDLVDKQCQHYHSSDCIYDTNDLSYINMQGKTQADVNKHIDTILVNHNSEIESIKGDIYSTVVRGYSRESIFETNILDLLARRMLILESENNIIPHSVFIYGLNEFEELVTTNVQVSLKLEFRTESDELVFDYSLSSFNKIKKLLIKDIIKNSNIFKPIKKVYISNMNSIVLDEVMGIEIKLLYDLI